MSSSLGRRRFLAGGLAASVALGLVGCRQADGEGDDEPPGTARPDGEREVSYGDEALQRVGVLRPSGTAPAAGWPVVVLVHGGFWEAGYDRTLMDPLAVDLAGRGYAAWNVDYRPAEDGSGGGWPGTFTDVADAVDAVAATDGLDAERVAVVGHSAGGTLALWAAARGGLPADAPGAGPLVLPVLAVSLAGINNLIAGSFEGLGRGAVDRLMGGPPTDADDPYSLASPHEQLPIGIDQLIQYGGKDAIVPAEQAVRYVAKAKEVEKEATVTLSHIPEAGHFDLIDPDQAGWRAVVAALAEALDG